MIFEWPRVWCGHLAASQAPREGGGGGDSRSIHSASRAFRSWVAPAGGSPAGEGVPVENRSGMCWLMVQVSYRPESGPSMLVFQRTGS